jgi:catechol-2,3-dioxygenase
LPAAPPAPETLPPRLQVMLRVGDLEKSTAWYRDVLGMQVRFVT